MPKNADMKITKMMVGILKDFGSPRFHGNGFIQLYVAENIRIHIWSFLLPPLRDHNAMVHNHRYDVVSTIYSGTLIHTTYFVDENHAEPDVRVIQLQGASKGQLTPDLETGIVGKLMEKHKYYLPVGSRYTMCRPYFHTGEQYGVDPVVTIFERYNMGEEWAQVICGKDDEQPTHAFGPGTQPTEENLWKAIEAAMYFMVKRSKFCAFFRRIKEFKHAKDLHNGELK